MKAKNIILTMMMVLTSTIASLAQEGESTKEGVPVVNEIITDSNATIAPTKVSMQNTTTVGSWSVTYTGDSISGEDMEDFEEAMKELFSEHEELMELIGGVAGVGAATGGLIIAGIVLLCIFGLPILFILFIIWLIVKISRRNSAESTARQTVAGDSPNGATRDRTLFNKGIRNLCLGVGLAVFLGIWMGDFGVGIGVLVVCIGIGELLVDYFSRR